MTTAVTGASGKPPWVRFPWSILFDPVGLKGLKPWDVDLSGLLSSLMAELKRFGLVNFSIPGIALVSSASIYRLKTELVLKLEEPPPPPVEESPVEGPIVAMSLPFRYEYGSLTIEELLAAIREVLAGGGEESPSEARPRLQLAEPAIPFSLPVSDGFMAQIEEKIESLYQRLLGLFEDEKQVLFSRLIEGLERRPAIQTFIALLFLVCQRKVSLWQHEESGDIYVTPPTEAKVVA
ncbi:MAG: hypothetical protein QW057_09090 [Candidatus Bathyarchaeia archaeon]